MPDSTGFSPAPRLEISPYHTCDAIELLKLGHRQVSEWFKDHSSYDAAVHDHADVKRLIDQVLQSSPVDELFDSRVRILGDVMAQHMADEECFGGLLAEAVGSAMDLDVLGLQLRARLRQLEADRH